ncbi:MAG: 3-phosphoshikimate 1-carboxyvinyltransferase [Nitrospina sp.]|nr:3-phosphoshikimate 1-carboxyvinyltransferase [Nitrospina sp.]MBT3414575.1 3-phosphoshikimate 1-carboxyvinyltransferase [Nitrospina sp.]MBT3856744.1 3-phosphoshikimate 1-carboxyvinyltransferase [Nitrospina sp.]MBT4103440.1 3-phosphoshikimate 1-carboxyvinyltransferase [Nitrospina sp.]MBT4390619.1 3-phosphoshikimate 1-carboxyvinyltransferase [Nitrospina sp.]
MPQTLIEVKPLQNLQATVTVPGSKSYTNRALLIAGLTDGECRLEKPLVSDDTKYMIRALKAFGVSVQEGKDVFIVSGSGGKLSTPKEDIFIGNAGTAMRFLTTFSALAPGKTRLDGDERMRQRPLADLLDCLTQMGVKAVSANGNGCPPIDIAGGEVPGGDIQLAGDKSSQYLTSILLSAPYFKDDTCIHIQGDLTSKSYADITLDIMKTFGVHVDNESYQRFKVKAGDYYKAQTYQVESDWSSASYFLAAAAVTGGEVTLTDINPHSVQGDAQFTSVLEKMGCRVEKKANALHIKGNPLRGITINMNNMPDAVQTLAVIALFAEGETVIEGIGNLRIKETDRISALANELTRLGAGVEAGEDFLIIRPGDYKGAEVETYDDHRMAMSFAVAGLKIPGVRIKDPKCVEKSFPDFFQRFANL